MSKAECTNRFDTIGCSAALQFCEEELMSPFLSTGELWLALMVAARGGTLTGFWVW
jgi:hypothetical protein